MSGNDTNPFADPDSDPFSVSHDLFIQLFARECKYNNTDKQDNKPNVRSTGSEPTVLVVGSFTNAKLVKLTKIRKTPRNID